MPKTQRRVLKLLGATALSVALTVPGTAWAEKQDHQTVEPQSAKEQVADAIADQTFTSDERQKIQDYFLRRKPDDGDDDDDDNEDDDGGDTPGKKSGKGKGKSKSKDTSHASGGKSKNMPHGLAKRDDLPPGLAKQLEKNGTLPPGLAKRNLPNDLEGRLPRRLDGTRRFIVDNDVILLDEKSGRILDIMRGVAATGLI